MENKIKKTFEELYGVERANEIKERTKKTRIEKGCSGQASTDEKEKERRRKVSAAMKGNPKAGGKRYGSGRGKHGWYKGYYCDSSWELAWVIYHIENNIQFERNHEGFNYVYKNESHKYYPDFIKEGVYYEIKGYKTKEFDAKKSQFPHELIILYGKNLKDIFEYVINKYGKSFIYLYEDKKYVKFCVKCNNTLYVKNKSGLCQKCYLDLIKSNPKKISKKAIKKTNNCLVCGKLIEKNKTQLCKKCYKPQIVYKLQIDKNELEKLIKEFSYEKIGKMFNVSGNTIKKRALKMGIELENKIGYWGKVYGEIIQNKKEIKCCKICGSKLSFKNKSGYCSKCSYEHNFKIKKDK